MYAVIVSLKRKRNTGHGAQLHRRRPISRIGKSNEEILRGVSRVAAAAQSLGDPKCQDLECGDVATAKRGTINGSVAVPGNQAPESGMHEWGSTGVKIELNERRCLACRIGQVGLRNREREGVLSGVVPRVIEVVNDEGSGLLELMM